MQQIIKKIKKQFNKELMNIRIKIKKILKLREQNIIKKVKIVKQKPVTVGQNFTVMQN